jgi:hypothetical protein
MRNALRFHAKQTAVISLGLCALLPVLFAGRSLARPVQDAQSQAQREAARLASVELVLPPKLVAGQPATLATLGADHKLVGHVQVELADGTRLETDATGRANFTTPSGRVLIAKAGGGSAATLIDSPSEAVAQRAISVPPFAALHNSFNLCGGGFNGNAEANHVAINDEPALVLAASPECLVVTPGANTTPGAAKISVEDTTPVEEASTTLVALAFEQPRPPLTPGKKGLLTVRARGSDQRLRIMVQNESFDVLQFEKGDVQELATSGGARNIAQLLVQAIRSGDFSFHARILPPPDPETARRFLAAAQPLAIGNLPNTLKKMEDDLAHHPRDAEKIRAELDRMLQVTSPADFRTLLEAARSSL